MNTAANPAAPRELNWWDDLPQSVVCQVTIPDTPASYLQRAADAATFCLLMAGDRLEQAVAKLLSDARERLRTLAAMPERSLVEHSIRDIRCRLDEFDWGKLEPQSWAHIKRCDHELAAAIACLQKRAAS